MKATVNRAGEPIEMDDYAVGSAGFHGDDEIKLEITGDDGEPWIELVLSGAEALEIGAWGTQWLALRLLERSAKRDAPEARGDDR